VEQMSLKQYLRTFGLSILCPRCKSDAKVEKAEGGDNVVCYCCGNITKIVNKGDE